MVSRLHYFRLLVFLQVGVYVLNIYQDIIHFSVNSLNIGLQLFDIRSHLTDIRPHLTDIRLHLIDIKPHFFLPRLHLIDIKPHLFLPRLQLIDIRPHLFLPRLQLILFFYYFRQRTDYIFFKLIIFQNIHLSAVNLCLIFNKNVEEVQLYLSAEGKGKEAGDRRQETGDFKFHGLPVFFGPGSSGVANR